MMYLVFKYLNCVFKSMSLAKDWSEAIQFIELAFWRCGEN